MVKEEQVQDDVRASVSQRLQSPREAIPTLLPVGVTVQSWLLEFLLGLRLRVVQCSVVCFL